MSKAVNLKMENERLLTMAGNLLNGYFLKPNKELGKKRFKEIQDGKAIQLGTLQKGEEDTGVPLKLLLDSSEYRGHLTFHFFVQALSSMLSNYQNYLPNKKKAPLFTNEQTGAGIFLVPGVVEHEEQVNMLVLGVEGMSDGLRLKLQFIDPEQFRADSTAEQAE